MMKKIDWTEVDEVKEFEKLPPGGYVCKITAVEDRYEKEYLFIEYDIEEGKFKGHFKELYDGFSFWGGSFIRSYKETARSFFKGFLTALEQSNSGFKFDNDERALVGKIVGLVLGDEEYEGKDGTVKVRKCVAQIHSADKIRKKDFKVPDIKKLKATEAMANLTDIADDDDMPF